MTQFLLVAAWQCECDAWALAVALGWRLRGMCVHPALYLLLGCGMCTSAHKAEGVGHARHCKHTHVARGTWPVARAAALSYRRYGSALTCCWAAARAPWHPGGRAAGRARRAGGSGACSTAPPRARRRA